MRLWKPQTSEDYRPFPLDIRSGMKKMFKNEFSLKMSPSSFFNTFLTSLLSLSGNKSIIIYYDQERCWAITMLFYFFKIFLHKLKKIQLKKEKFKTTTNNHSNILYILQGRNPLYTKPFYCSLNTFSTFEWICHYMLYFKKNQIVQILKSLEFIW